MFARASSFSALVGMAVDVVGLFMALLSFVESAPRAYRLKASNAAPPISTSIGTIPTACPLSGQVEIPLIVLCRFLRPALGSAPTQQRLLSLTAAVAAQDQNVQAAIIAAMEPNAGSDKS
jgi:hypothetical protein